MHDLLNFLFADDTTALKKVQAFLNLETLQILSFRNWECGWEPINLKIIVFHPEQKQVENFQFIFNCNDLNSFPDPRFIFPIKRINNSSRVPAFKILGVFLDKILILYIILSKLETRYLRRYSRLVKLSIYCRLLP